jgi:hypothetical protein
VVKESNVLGWRGAGERKGKERKGKEEEEEEGEINVSNQPPNFFLLHLWCAYLSVSCKDSAK